MSRARIIALVEGQTEQTFVREVLAPWLASRGVDLSPRLVGKPGHKGGAGKYPRARRDLLALLKQEATTIVTTMFDFFGMPKCWPGRQKAAKAPHEKKAAIVEAALLEDIATAFAPRYDARRFVPYIQMYEYEALLFARPEVIADVVQMPEIAGKLAAVRKAFETPEHINDDPKTAPSKRIDTLAATYDKPLHGSIAAKRIGIDTMLAECPHFHEWLVKLQATGKRRTK